MSIAVVDLLEAVEVGDEHRTGVAAVEQIGKLRFQTTPVEEAGQGVAVGEFSQSGLLLLALGDVLKLAEPTQRMAVRAAQEGQVRDRPDLGTVGPQEALLALPGV